MELQSETEELNGGAFNASNATTDAASSVSKDKKIKVDRNQEFPAIKVQLPKDVAGRVLSALTILKERKADTKVDELLAEFLETLSQKFLDEQIERRTPEDYYLEAAAAIPELKAKLVEQAKKALLQEKQKPSIPRDLLISSKKKEKKMKPGSLAF